MLFILQEYVKHAQGKDKADNIKMILSSNSIIKDSWQQKEQNASSTSEELINQ